ncbi:MAG: hypothetical protein LBD25_04240 [Coriobacteriales bacterium]|jgi:pyrrolysyl-tRNA synthetase-like protein|nr:hypothetical protein [Coriobacteriales bacterium]
MSPQKSTKRYIYKNQSLYSLIDRVKLWPGRTGTLHGIKSVTRSEGRIDITTHCGEAFVVWDSRSSRAARWLRNRWFKKPCPACKIPAWKLEKYHSTVFTDAQRKGGKR